MALPSKILEQIAFNTRPKIEENMLIVTIKSKPEEHLSQPLQTKSKQFKIPITLKIGYYGIFNVTNKINKFYFTVSIIDNYFNQITISPGAYEKESLNNENKRIILEER